MQFHRTCFYFHRVYLDPHRYKLDQNLATKNEADLYTGISDSLYLEIQPALLQINLLFSTLFYIPWWWYGLTWRVALPHNAGYRGTENIEMLLGSSNSKSPTHTLQVPESVKT